METKSLRDLHFGYPISPIQEGHALGKQNSPRSVKQNSSHNQSFLAISKIIKCACATKTIFISGFDFVSLIKAILKCLVDRYKVTL